MTETRRSRTHLVVAGLLALGIIGTAALITLTGSPDSRFLDEDGFVENLTLALYLVAACFALAGAFVAYSAGRRRLEASGVFGLAVLFALEELSFGERIFGYRPPVVLGIKLDALHDLVHLTLKWGKTELESGSVITAGILGVVVLVGAALVVRSRARIADLVLRAWRNPAGRYVMLCLAFGAAALAADLRSGVWPVARLLEETFEAQAALALVVAATIFVEPRRQVERGRTIRPDPALRSSR